MAFSRRHEIYIKSKLVCISSCINIFLFILYVDDGKTKPTPKPDERKTKNKKGKVTKPSSEPTPIVDPDFMCLIRANYRAEKISTVVSFEEIIRKVF